MNEITTRQTALEIMGIDEKRLSEIRNPSIISNVEARKGFPMRSLTQSEISVFLSEQFQMVMENLGQKNTSGLLSATMETVSQDLKRVYFNWTREEMSNAWRLGSTGQLGGEEVHLSARNLFRWLNQYDDQHRKPAYAKLKRLEAVKKLDGEDITEKKDMTTEEKKTALNEAFNDWKDGNFKAPSYYYKILAELGLCKIKDANETWELIGRANVELLKEIKALEGISREEAINRKNAIKGINRENPESIPEFVKNRAKQIKVFDYFASLPKNFIFQ